MLRRLFAGFKFYYLASAQTEILRAATASACCWSDTNWPQIRHADMRLFPTASQLQRVLP